MIIHAVTFRWKPEVTDAQVAEFESRLSRMPSLVPALRGYRFGRDLGLREGTGDFAVCALVDDEASLVAYLDHPDHAALGRDLISVMAAERLAVQFSVPPDTMLS